MQVRKANKQLGAEPKRPKLSLPELTTYDSPPDCASKRLSVEEIEAGVFKRLSAYHFVETKLQRGLSKADIAAEMNAKLHLFDFGGALSDFVSHVVVRVGHCQSEALRKLFVRAEEVIFRSRFLLSPESQKQAFAASQNLRFDALSREEAAQMAADRKAPPGLAEERVFKVPFEKVLRLVETRAVFLTGGFAMVPERFTDGIVFANFRSLLARKAAKTARLMLGASLDERIRPIVDAIASRAVLSEKRYARPAGEIALADIEDLSQKSFPPCMRNSYEHLKRDAHLKHGGRMHLALFLKSAGLPLAEAMRFWRERFARRTDAARFDRLYAYAIRHFYGRAGQGVDYDPFSCSKVVNTAPNAGDHCGCPFKLFDAKRVALICQSYGLSEGESRDVVEKKNGGHFQVACSRLFGHAHKGVAQDDVAINHPNGFFEQSVAHLKKMAETGL